MAGKFLTLDEAAEKLGISAEKLKEMRQDQKVHGYRDGQSWKFKPEEIERVQNELAAGGDEAEPIDLDDIPIELGPEEDVVLLSEVELGESGPGTSSTVIGKAGQAADDESDIRVITPEDKEADIGSAETMVGRTESDVKLIPEDDIDLDLGGESDLPIDLGSDLGSPVDSIADSTVDLSGREEVDDADVLGGSSGPDSDITIGGGDSGISLIDPADSGLSLEDPLDLSLGSDVPLAKTGADEVDLEVAGGEQAFELASDDDFLLTPMEEAAEEDSEDSGSQVIALDESGELDDAAVGLEADADDMGAMLEEDTGEALEMEEESAPVFAATTTVAATPVARESQFSVWQIVSLSSCILILTLTGMMMFDLTQNMWSWGGTTPLTSSIMDGILGLLPN